MRGKNTLKRYISAKQNTWGNGDRESHKVIHSEEQNYGETHYPFLQQNPICAGFCLLE